MQQAQAITDKALAALKDLIRVNLDSAEEFRAAARVIESTRIASLFQEIAQEHESHASELQRLLEIPGEEIPDSGSVTGSVRAWLLAAGGKLNGGRNQAVLMEAERNGDAIGERYERVLPQVAGNALNEFLRRQHAEVKRAQDCIRELRSTDK